MWQFRGAAEMERLIRNEKGEWVLKPSKQERIFAKLNEGAWHNADASYNEES